MIWLFPLLFKIHSHVHFLYQHTKLLMIGTLLNCVKWLQIQFFIIE